SEEKTVTSAAVNVGMAIQCFELGRAARATTSSRVAGVKPPYHPMSDVHPACPWPNSSRQYCTTADLAHSAVKGYGFRVGGSGVAPPPPVLGCSSVLEP